MAEGEGRLAGKVEETARDEVDSVRGVTLPVFGLLPVLLVLDLRLPT